MKNLLATLHDYDPGMLPALADVWGVDAKRFNDQQLIEALHARMMDESAAQAVWDKLDEKAQGALRMLAGSKGGRMTSSVFAHVGNGAIRKLGRAANRQAASAISTPTRSPTPSTIAGLSARRTTTPPAASSASCMCRKSLPPACRWTRPVTTTWKTRQSRPRAKRSPPGDSR